MIDTYLKSEDATAFLTLIETEANIIGPIKGRAAIPEQSGEGETFIPAQAAMGDPSCWYVCIRAKQAVESWDGVTLCSPEEGQAVCGVWASEG